MISSELPEVVGICDRVLVMREGVIAGEVGSAPGTRPSPRKTIMRQSQRARPKERP